MSNPLDSIDTWIAYNFLSERGLTLENVAYELHLNERRLREHIRDGMADITRRMQAEPDKVARVRRGLEERFPAEESEEDALPKIDHKKVVKLLKQDKTIEQIAEALKIERAVFVRWYGLNLPIVNKLLTQAG